MREKYNENIESLMLLYFKYYNDSLYGVDLLQRVSGILLFRDYITKMLVWKNKLNNHNFSLLDRASHDLFSNFSGELWISELIPLEDFNSLLVNSGFKLRGRRHFDSYFLYWFITWEIFKNYKAINQFGLSNPYEPAALIIERGQSVFYSEGKICIDYLFFNNNYPGFRLPSLDVTFLDYIDNHFSFADIPDRL